MLGATTRQAANRLRGRVALAAASSRRFGLSSVCDDAVEPVWKEQAFRRILGTVGDVEDLSRRATVGDRVVPGRMGRNVGEAAKKRSVLGVARVSDRRICRVADATIIHIRSVAKSTVRIRPA